MKHASAKAVHQAVVVAAPAVADAAAAAAVTANDESNRLADPETKARRQQSRFAS